MPGIAPRIFARHVGHSTHLRTGGRVRRERNNLWHCTSAENSLGLWLPPVTDIWKKKEKEKGFERICGEKKRVLRYNDHQCTDVRKG